MKRKWIGMLVLAVLFLALGGTLLIVQTTAAGTPPEDAASTSVLTAAASAWSSGWQTINRGQTITFTHNLGLPPEELGVELWFLDTDGGMGINRAGYGGVEISGDWRGAFWQHLTANTVRVTRLPNDNSADQIKIRVWDAPTPDYDSGWQTIALGNTWFNHNLGITDTELVASMWFSDTVHGIHHFSYGGLTDGSNQTGAYWMRLTDNSVQVYRRPDDTNVEQVRVMVTQADPPPDYDSLIALGDWQDIAQGGAFTFTHNLNWNPNLLTVRSECYDTTPGGAAINQISAGGDQWVGGGLGGAHIQRLTANTVQLVRWANDTSCDRARIRIWKRAYQVFLPLLERRGMGGEG